MGKGNLSLWVFVNPASWLPLAANEFHTLFYLIKDYVYYENLACNDYLITKMPCSVVNQEMCTFGLLKMRNGKEGNSLVTTMRTFSSSPTFSSLFGTGNRRCILPYFLTCTNVLASFLPPFLTAIT